MNKPSWKDAPEWAQWLTQSDDGQWGWYEFEPHRVAYGWNGREGRCVLIPRSLSVRSVLAERRPVPKDSVKSSFYILASNDPNHLSTVVCRYLQDGWKLHGDVFSTALHPYNQAMVKNGVSAEMPGKALGTVEILH